MSKNKFTQYIVNVLILAICIGSIFVGNQISTNIANTKSALKASIEKEWREQAKRTLSRIQVQFQNDLVAKVVDPNDDYSLQAWAKTNLTGVLNGGPTGDAFMVHLYYDNSNKLVGKFIWDDSPDCVKESFITNGRYLSDEAAMHNDPVQAAFILDKMLLGTSTLDYDYKYWWNFDGEPEYLEWIVQPDGSLGFNGESRNNGGITNTKYTKVLIALGTQQDEVTSTFSEEFDTLDKTEYFVDALIAIVFIACIFNLFLYIYANKRIRR